jgi:RNA polymerase sigma factor (sigma-70 family)
MTADYKNVGPQELWQRFKAGDERAFGELAKVHYRSLYNYGSRLTPDSELVWDTIQDLLLELWDRRATVGDAVFVKTYLLKALRYKLLKGLSHAMPTAADESVAEQLVFDVPVEQQIIDDENQTEQIRHLHRLMATLSKRQQEVLYLRFYQNLENHEIAQIMGLERQSVANLLHRTFKELRTHWPTSTLLTLLGLLFQ